LPALVKLNDLRIKYLLRSPESLNARLLLIDVYLLEECESKLLEETVKAINDYTNMKEKERMNQVLETEPIT
jgi:hypothetical protein